MLGSPEDEERIMTTRTVLCTALAAICTITPLRAQEPQTEAGALAAAVRFVRTMPRVGDDMPIVADTAAVRRGLTRCTEMPGAAPKCELVDGRTVGMVLVEFRPPQWALVEFREYQVMRRTCPDWSENPDLPEPLVAYPRSTTLTLVYADGRWTWDGRGQIRMC